MRVLNVDDRDENRYLLESLLKGNGFEVDTAGNGAEALELLQSGSYDLIISDILMPVMDGFQLCRTVRTDERWRSIPFIFYTATYTGPQDEAFALKIGANRFIQKPCEPSLFMEAVHSVLNSAKDNFPPPEPPAQDEEVLKLYSERLVRKLEQKMEQLEKEAEARKHAEVVLRQNEKKYRSLYNSIRDAIVVVDRQRVIMDCNQAFVDLFGYSLAEVEGESSLVIYGSEEEFDKLGTILKDYKKVETHLHSANFKKKNGKVFPGEINIFFFKSDEGEIEGFIGLIRDITERTQAEETQRNLESQLMQAQKMESVGRLAGGVAHDYNNMLSVILGYSELILRKLDPSDPLRRDLGEIHKAAVRSMEITRQLLTFARQQTIAPVPFDLNEAVEKMLKMLRRLIGEDIDLVWHPETGLWPVKMDPSQLDQILANLCVNARDAIEGVGKITIETERATFDDTYCADHHGFVPGDYVLLAVSDDGCGMEKEIVSKIFEPFFTTKAIGHGTGLGLATVYGIVKQNEGFVSVYSEPGKGTTFKIYLARHTEHSTAVPEERRARMPKGNGETILVVEDEASILRIVKRILEDLGYTALLANSPKQALRLAGKSAGEIDLLLTDVVLPEMNGKELSHLVAEVCPGIRTLFMSGYTADVIAHRGVLEEGVDFIQKPFSRENMAIKIRQALGNDARED
jgi:two-component system, cell cycle sensor histidine kinase and response regulator CckA